MPLSWKLAIVAPWLALMLGLGISAVHAYNPAVAQGTVLGGGTVTGATTFSGDITMSGADINMGLGNKLIIDSDGDTYITSTLDDFIDFHVLGANKLRITNVEVEINAFQLDLNGKNLNGGATEILAVDPINLGGNGAVAADPCGTISEGSIFYNTTSDYICFCNGAGADLKMDGTTACF